MIRQWNEFIRRSSFHASVVFLSDYDMLLTQRMVGGVDVWINTPRRPWETSGTSGMKVLANGGLNLSEIDGWWAEAYTPAVGWAVGDGHEHGDDPAWDAIEADAVYTLLENQIIPEFYQRNQAGIPVAWVARIRESMGRLAPQHSANRVVRQYSEEHDLPVAAAYAARADEGGKLGAEILAWQQSLASDWNTISFGPLQVESKNSALHFEIPVYLGKLSPEAVSIELFADGQYGNGPVRKGMERRAAPIKGSCTAPVSKGIVLLATLQCGWFRIIAARLSRSRRFKFFGKGRAQRPRRRVRIPFTLECWIKSLFATPEKEPSKHETTQIVETPVFRCGFHRAVRDPASSRGVAGQGQEGGWHHGPL